MDAPCTLHGGRPRLPAVAWAYLPADSILLHQAPSKMWPADLEFRNDAARTKWESVQRGLETLDEFPAIVQRMAYKEHTAGGATTAISAAILERLRADLARVKDELPEGMREAEARAWDRAARAIDEALRRVKWGK